MITGTGVYKRTRELNPRYVIMHSYRKTMVDHAFRYAYARGDETIAMQTANRISRACFRRHPGAVKRHQPPTRQRVEAMV